MSSARSYTLAELVERFGGELLGDAGVRVERVASLAEAQAGAISFLANPKYRRLLANTRASALILSPAERDSSARARILTANPYGYFAKVANLLNPAPPLAAGVHASAVIDPSARIAASARIDAHCSVDANAHLEAQVALGAGCRIGAGAVIGARTRLGANVVVGHDCRLGADCIVHPGVVIGADGFGFAPEGEGWIKVPQLGAVRIGDAVEVGANTTIDRGTLGDTVIEDGVKLDNQIQVGHNVHIGAHSALAACVGIAGSARIGRHCMIGGAAGILGHLEICDNVTIGAFSLVTKSIGVPGLYAGSLPILPQRAWQANFARVRHLEELHEKLVRLEQELARMKGEQA